MKPSLVDAAFVCAGLTLGALWPIEDRAREPADIRVVGGPSCPPAASVTSGADGAPPAEPGGPIAGARTPTAAPSTVPSSAAPAARTAHLVELAILDIERECGLRLEVSSVTCSAASAGCAVSFTDSRQLALGSCEPLGRLTGPHELRRRRVEGDAGALYAYELLPR